MAGLLILGGGFYLFNNALFNGMDHPAKAAKTWRGLTG